MFTNFEGNLRLCTFVMKETIHSRSFVTPKIKPIVLARNYSTNLAFTLASELQRGRRRYLPTQDEANPIKESGFTLVESPDSPLVRLVKNVDEKTVAIEFLAKEHIQEFDIIHEEGEEQRKKIIKPTSKPMVEFNIIVKDEKGKGLLFQCGTENSELKIFRVGYYKDLAQRLSPEGEQSSKSYDGPTFMGLEEHLRVRFMEYLESLGITDKVLEYVTNAALDKEQKLYMKWLEDIKAFTN